MRKFTAIILCAAFILSQYARQVTYLECRLANYFDIPAEKCDCEKLLVPNDTVGDEPPLPARHNHVHIDELFYLSFNSIQGISDFDYCSAWNITQPFLLNDGAVSTIEHPPQFH